MPRHRLRRAVSGVRPGAVASLVVAAFLVATPCALADDRVVFRDGGDVRGVVEKDDADEVVIRVGAERRHYPKRIVGAVVLDPTLHAPAKDPAAPAGTKDPSAAAAPSGAAHASSAPSAAAAPAIGGRPPADGELAIDFAAIAKIETGTPVERATALRSIGDAWPRSRPTFEAALTHRAAAVRLAAISLLGDVNVADPALYVAETISDPAPAVRRIAVRLVRTLALRALEPRLIAKVASDVDRGVKVEALRSLEEVGTAACLPAVLREMTSDPETTTRPRYLRVLRRVTGEDCGDDVEAWGAAVERFRRAAEERRTEKPAPEPSRR